VKNPVYHQLVAFLVGFAVNVDATFNTNKIGRFTRNRLETTINTIVLLSLQ